MDDYPDFPISIESEWLPASFRLTDFDASGQVRIRDLLAGATPYQGTIVHDIIDTTERDTLTAFYDAHRLIAFNLTFGVDVWPAKFGASAPKYRPISGGYWRAEVDMMSEGL